MIQEIITYLIGLVVILIIGRWLIRTIKGSGGGGCTTCESCHQRCDCNEPK